MSQVTDQEPRQTEAAFTLAEATEILLRLTECCNVLATVGPSGLPPHASKWLANGICGPKTMQRLGRPGDWSFVRQPTAPPAEPKHFDTGAIAPNLPATDPVNARCRVPAGESIEGRIAEHKRREEQ